MTKNIKSRSIYRLKTTIVLILAVWVTGCGITTSGGGGKSSYIFVVDLTQSVSGEARAKTFEALRRQTQKLKRGDSLTVIPLTGDALVETSGNVLRFQAAEKREAFDADLRKFFAEVEQKLTEMEATAKSYKQTDLFGALRVAREEIVLTKGRRILLVVLSDMVNSTAEFRFEKDAVFQKSETARELAEKLTRDQEKHWQGVEVYLGSLESTDLRQMSNQRRGAVRDFWEEFFRRNGAARYQYATDGPGQLPKFINVREENL